MSIPASQLPSLNDRDPPLITHRDGGIGVTLTSSTPSREVSIRRMDVKIEPKVLGIFIRSMDGCPKRKLQA